MSTVFLTLLIILISILAYIFHKAWKGTEFWTKRGVPHIKPYLFLGNSARAFFKRIGIHEAHLDVCREYPNEPVVGFYDYARPKWIIKDVDYAELILIKDFSHFVDRGFPMDEKNPLNTNLALMTGKKWRAFRMKLAPMFTSGKIRSMYETMAACGDDMLSMLSNMEKNEDIEMKDILTGFSMDVIGSCTFGLETGHLANPNTEFRRMGLKASHLDLWMIIKYILLTNVPWLPKLLGLSINRGPVIEYFAGIVRNALNYRRTNKVYRNDFIQLMLQLQEKGYVEIQTKDASDDYLEIDTSNYKTESFEITEDMLIGLSIVFITAGFEGLTNTMTFALYEISKHEDVQLRVREEIQRNVKEKGGLTYDTVKEMVYLEQCIKETLRLHSATPALCRFCTKEYTLPNGLIIYPGESVMVSVGWFHFNPEYFPEPEKFIPERFNPDQSHPKCAWMPFGLGPRMCIGMRFAMMEMKFCLAKLFLNYKFRVSPKTREPLVNDPNRVISSPKYPVLFNLTQI